MRINILNDQGVVEKTIIATPAVAEEMFPGRWEISATPHTFPKNKLSKREFIRKLVKHGKITEAQLLVLRKNPAYEFLWWEFELTDEFPFAGGMTDKMLDVLRNVPGIDVDAIRNAWNTSD